MKKDVKLLKTLKTLKDHFNNRLVNTFKNKQVTKKFITKINSNINDVEKKMNYEQYI